MLYLTFFLSFLLCLILTPVIRFVAVRKGWMAYPVKERWHKKPTALMGGIAIYVSMAIPLFFISDFSTILPHITFSLPNADSSLVQVSDLNQYVPLPTIGGVIWIGMTLLFFLGLCDDFIHIRPHTKLVGQILVASMVTFLGFRLHWFGSLTLDTVVTILWIVGLTNALNLIDNMDGLCAGIGCIAALYLAFLFSSMVQVSDPALVQVSDLNHQGGVQGFLVPSGLQNLVGSSLRLEPTASLAAAILAGSLAGFLFYNFNPASIFMGDSGSLVIGFVLSMLTLHYSGENIGNTLSSYAIPIMVLMVPILDTTMVTLIRILSGRKASVGGKDHTSHRLVLMGFSEKGAVLFLYGVGAISGVSALFVSRNDTFTSPAVIIPLAISVLLMGIYLAQLRVYPEKEFSLLRDHAYTPILMELTYKRQIILVILDFCLIAFAYYLSYRLRFDSDEFPFYFRLFLHSLPAVIACKFIAFFIIGIYRGFWQYLSTKDVFTYIKASFFATLLSVVAVTFIYRFKDFSKGIFIIDWLLTTGLLLGTRGSFRISLDTMSRKTLSGETVLIYGAGRGGEILLRELLHNGSHHIRPIGFIDDDLLKIGKEIQGYPILGSFQDIESLLEKHQIHGLLISFRNGDIEKIAPVRNFCRANSLFLKKFSIELEDVEIGKS